MIIAGSSEGRALDLAPLVGNYADISEEREEFLVLMHLIWYLNAGLLLTWRNVWAGVAMLPEPTIAAAEGGNDCSLCQQILAFAFALCCVQLCMPNEDAVGAVLYRCTVSMVNLDSSHRKSPHG